MLDHVIKYTFYKYNSRNFERKLNILLKEDDISFIWRKAPFGTKKVETKLDKTVWFDVYPDVLKSVMVEPKGEKVYKGNPMLLLIECPKIMDTEKINKICEGVISLLSDTYIAVILAMKEEYYDIFNNLLCNP